MAKTGIHGMKFYPNYRKCFPINISVDSAPFSLLATAIGTHDFANVDWSLLSFPAMNRPMAICLILSPLVEPGTNELLGPQQLVNNTQLWFDMGRVSFIHLPYTTEEEENILPMLVMMIGAVI